MFFWGSFNSLLGVKFTNKTGFDVKIAINVGTPNRNAFEVINNGKSLEIEDELCLFSDTAVSIWPYPGMSGQFFDLNLLEYRHYNISTSDGVTSVVPSDTQQSPKLKALKQSVLDKFKSKKNVAADVEMADLAPVKLDR